jgi:hypothetical protein
VEAGRREDRQALDNRTFPRRIGPAPLDSVRLCVWRGKKPSIWSSGYARSGLPSEKPLCLMEPNRASPRYRSNLEHTSMLVERGLRVMHVEAASEALAIAWNYLSQTGAIDDPREANDRLVAIIADLFNRGEFNKIRLANRAIARFLAPQ